MQASGIFTIKGKVKKIFADKSLYSTILPIGDGVAISVKNCD
jgi:hypothetical protein